MPGDTYSLSVHGRYMRNVLALYLKKVYNRLCTKYAKNDVNLYHRRSKKGRSGS